MDPSISCLRDFKSPSCATSSQSSLVTPSRRKESTPSCLENTPQVHNISIESTVKVKSSSPNSQRPLKRRLLSAFDKSADHFEGLPKKRRLSRRSCDSSRSASKSPQRSPASTSSCLSDNEPTQQEQVERRNTTNRSTEVVLGGKKLTERQQLAMLLEMTAKDNPVPVEEDEECSVPRGSAPAPRQSRPIDDSVARRIPARLDKRNERGETPLHVAAIRGDAALVAALIGRGADVMIKDHAGWTPLHDACSHGHVDVVVELLDGGTPVNASGFCRDRPMHDAASNGHINVVQVLLKYGGDPKLSNTKGETPLDYALSRGHTEVVKLLEASSSTCKGFVDATVPLGVQRPSNESSISSRTEAHDLCEPGSPANSSFDSTGVCHDESISSPMPTFNDCVPSSEDSDGGSETPVGSPLPVSVASKPCLAAEVVMPPLPMSPFSDTQSPVKRGITASCLPPSVPLTPKSFLPSHRFRTPRSAITSRDSGICVNSSTSSYSCSPARTDLDDGCISACSTPRHCIPPSALPRLSPKKSPEPAPTPKAFSRARFDTSALVSFQQKLQSASKTCAATEAPIPQSHSESSSQVSHVYDACGSRSCLFIVLVKDRSSWSHCLSSLVYFKYLVTEHTLLDYLRPY